MAAVVDQNAAHEEMGFRCDDELDRSIIDLPRIEQLHHLRILIPELIVGNPGYIENDAAFDGMAGPDLLENPARGEIAPSAATSTSPAA
jgi:hypothetical protein